jgi:predicted RND superfamily exporter protein
MMGGLGTVLASIAALDIASFMRKLKRNAVLYALALVFLLTAYALGIAALAITLGEAWGLPAGLLAVAGGALVLALILYFIAVLVNQAEERRKREVAARNSSRALMVSAAASALPAVAKSRSLLVLAVAGGLGFLAMKAVPDSWFNVSRRSDWDE